jgi:hypothetical protein
MEWALIKKLSIQVSNIKINMFEGTSVSVNVITFNVNVLTLKHWLTLGFKNGLIALFG